jgi:Ca2+-binding EF-hand superfamily protein
LYDVFKILDKDKNGKISKNELKKALNNEDIDEEELNQFIKKFDLNGDGEIDYVEFITNMSEITKDIK